MRPIVPPQVTTTNHAQNATVTTERHESVGTLPTGDAISDATSRVLESREELVLELRDQVKFLRAAVEQHQRSEAELRAALRTALAAMPKAITEGESSTRKDVEVSHQDKPQQPQNASMSQEPPDTKKAAQNGLRGQSLRDLRTILRTLFGFHG